MMDNASGRPSRPYGSFVLTLWQAGNALPDGAPVWRYSLEDPHTGERIGFGHADEVAQFLRQWAAATAAPDRIVNDKVDSDLADS